MRVVCYTVLVMIIHIKEDHRERAKVVRTCQEKRRRVRVRVTNNGRCNNARKETESTTERQKTRWKDSCKSMCQV